MRFSYCIILMLLLTPTLVSAQEALLATGGDASSPNGSVSCSIGQVVYEMYQTEDGSSAEGVQHPYELFIVTSTGEELISGQTVKAYPNPVVDWVEVQLGNFSETEKLQYQLYDIHGQVLLSDHITSERTTINLQNLAAGTYVLRVSGFLDRSFRLVKNN